MLLHTRPGAEPETSAAPVVDLARIPALARRLLRSPLAVLSVRDGGGSFSDAASRGGWRRRCATPIDRTLCSAVLQNGAPLVADDVREHPFLHAEPHLWLGEIGFASVPFHGDGGRVLGTLSLAEGRRRSWTDEDVELITALSRYAGILSANDDRDGADIATLVAASLTTSPGASLRMLRKAVETMQLGVTITDLAGSIVYSNPADARMHGYEPEELAGRDARILAPPGQARGWSPGQLDTARSWSRETVNVRKDGTIFPVQLRSDVVHDPRGKPVAIVTCCEDLTRRRAMETELVRNAFYDPVSGLPNVGLLRHRLDLTLDLSRRGGGRFSVVAIELDRVQLVRDSLGQRAGDEMVRSAGERLRECTPAEAMLAHIGPDTFAVLVDSPQALETATRVARCVQGMIREPFRAGGREVFTGASVGMVICGKEYADAEDVLRDAAICVLRAREAGDGGYQIFDPAMHGAVMARLQLEGDLRRALDRDELRLLFQPIVRLDSGRIHGFEALVRWEHPERGTILPDEFIPMAEETGLILPLGLWVLEASCRALRALQEGGSGEGIRMAVNLSPRQLGQPDLPSRVAAIVAASGIEPGSLDLEITESVFLEHSPQVLGVLRALRELGIGLHVDDFGTGYSSLANLHRLPLSALKIDRSFISGDHANGLQIVRTIVAMAHGLGVEVIGEGIETQAVQDELGSLACGFGQGYHLGRPMPLAAAAERLAAGTDR